jgi:predicted dehydrogenase
MNTTASPGRTLRWGIIGTGSIARKFATELPFSRTGRLVAVGSRSRAGAEKFAADFAGIRAWGSYEALLGDPEVDAVYIATPHTDHAGRSVAAAEAGKHILCEKPVALNQPDAMVALEAARRNGVFFMEAFMYRCHPRTRQIADCIAGGRIGAVRLIHANFGFAARFNPQSRLFSNALGGGGILDVGCYTTSVARLIAGAANGAPFAEPTALGGRALFAETGVDTLASATLEFPGGILAQISCGICMRQDSGLVVLGEEGMLRVSAFWNPPGPIELFDAAGNPVETLPGDPNPHKYAIEADAVADALPARESPFVPHEDTLGNMLTLDRWRRSCGLCYESENPGLPQTQPHP